jgi:hypothetical protein
MPRVKAWVRVLVIILVAVPALLVAVYLVQVAVLERRLVAEANAIIGASHPRPVHADAPASGTFGEALTPYLPDIEKASRIYAEDEQAKEVLSAILRGERPLADAPTRVLTDLEQLGSALDGVLRATHAERAEYASVADGFDPSPGTTGLGLQYAASLAGFRIRAAVAKGDVARAAAECLDGLALARDEAIAGGLIGRMLSVVIVDRLTYPCAEALTALPASQRRVAVSRLRTLRDAIPGLDALMREEAVWMQLMLHAPDLSVARLAELRQRPKLVTEDGRKNANPRSKRIAYNIAWPLTRAKYRQLARAAALPPAERDASLDVLASGTSWYTPDPATFRRYFRRADGALQELDLLVLAAGTKTYREDHGAWPTTPAALVEAGLVTPAEQQRAGAARFVPAANGGVDLGLKLVRPNDEAPERIVIVRISP